MEPYGFIYLIRNSVNGKIYVGQTTKSIKERFQQHKCDAHSGRGFHLHKAITKYGAHAFAIVILGMAFSKQELDEMEMRSIRTHDATNQEYGYNLTPGGQGCGNAKSPEHIAKIAAAHRGKKRGPLSPEHRTRIGAANKGELTLLNQLRR